MVSCPSSMVSAVCVVPFPPHAGGFLTLSISTTMGPVGGITHTHTHTQMELQLV